MPRTIVSGVLAVVHVTYAQPDVRRIKALVVGNAFGGPPRMETFVTTFGPVVLAGGNIHEVDQH